MKCRQYSDSVFLWLVETLKVKTNNSNAYRVYSSARIVTDNIKYTLSFIKFNFKAFWLGRGWHTIVSYWLKLEFSDLGWKFWNMMESQFIKGPCGRNYLRLNWHLKIVHKMEWHFCFGRIHEHFLRLSLLLEDVDGIETWILKFEEDSWICQIKANNLQENHKIIVSICKIKYLNLYCEHVKLDVKIWNYFSRHELKPFFEDDTWLKQSGD